jgi:3-phosphoshikimate 1-carboxyvinyltransferase
MKLHFSSLLGLGGRMTPPADKSITHRALMLAAVAEGECAVANPLATGDCLSTRACLAGLGAPVAEEAAGEGRPARWRIGGRGLRGLAEPTGVLDARNSGTTMRLLSGLLAGLPLYAVLTGDASLRSRPMLRVVEPLRSMGARIEGRAGGRLPPLSLLPGGGSLAPLRYELPVASAQVKSALLLAALRAEGESSLGGELGSRDHTERLFDFLGVPLRRQQGRLLCQPPRSIPAFELTVPGDPSSAAFFLAAALICGRELEVEGCGLNPTRLGFIDVLRRMGAVIETETLENQGGEPVGRLVLRPGPLQATEVSAAEIPSLVDEVPLLAVLGAFARGRTVVRGAEELRHKESDRLQAIARLLGAVGGRVERFADGFALEGPQKLRSGLIEPGGDHRIAMAAAVLASGISGGAEVQGFESAAVSFPDFLATYRALGGRAE